MSTTPITHETSLKNRPALRWTLLGVWGLVVVYTVMVLVGPISAAIVGLVISPEHSAPLAYISGTLGVLIGADLLHMKDISRLGTPYASIGGAGTFDGIFITGIVAALLA